jgi:5-methylcytosine-specific restriction endonuclease McrA
MLLVNKMKTFDLPTRELIWSRYRRKCANYDDPKCLIDQALSIHHVIHNTKVNQKLYGDWLQSAENGILLCQHCHTNYSLVDKVKQKEIELKNKLKNKNGNN